MEQNVTAKDERPEELNLLELLFLVRRELRFIVLFVGVITFCALAYALLAPVYYASRMTIYPAGAADDSPLSELQGLASSFGFAVPGSPTQIHIPDVLVSRRLRKRLVEAKWQTVKSEGEMDLVSYWGWDDLEREEGVARAVKKLGRLVDVSEETTGLIVVTVEMPERDLARTVAERLLAFVREYIQTEYRSVASIHRSFIERRLTETKEELREAEEALTEFLEANRRIQDSPELQLAYERLMREVEVRQEVFITLRQQNEIAKIGEIRESPVINILDPPETPIRKSRPKRLIIVAGTFMFSFALGVALSLFRQRAKGDWRSLLR